MSFSQAKSPNKSKAVLKKNKKDPGYQQWLQRLKYLGIKVS
ncbi:hypothetical protein KKC1_21840 [Calderihabitans maritimus]|uniref:Uncharacterized protein n=1 Tax=Calderihabitans maritimus TaxID=1246530 RepID=A0A1Z5HU30_9FIRM|nr:hypothetical protein KKC1_21840 [Calderihabitans maritimus]